RSRCLYHHTPTREIYTLSLHDALPISPGVEEQGTPGPRGGCGRVDLRERRRPREDVRDAPLRDQGREPGRRGRAAAPRARGAARSEEHTSELQSPDHLVCRLLLEKKKA